MVEKTILVPVKILRALADRACHEEEYAGRMETYCVCGYIEHDGKCKHKPSCAMVKAYNILGLDYDPISEQVTPKKGI